MKGFKRVGKKFNLFVRRWEGVGRKFRIVEKLEEKIK